MENRANYPKSSTNSNQRIPSPLCPFMGEDAPRAGAALPAGRPRSGAQTYPCKPLCGKARMSARRAQSRLWRGEGACRVLCRPSCRRSSECRKPACRSGETARPPNHRRRRPRGSGGRARTMRPDTEGQDTLGRVDTRNLTQRREDAIIALMSPIFTPSFLIFTPSFPRKRESRGLGTAFTRHASTKFRTSTAASANVNTP